MHLWSIFFDNCTKNHSMKKKSFFNKWCWDNWMSTCEKKWSGFLPHMLYKNQLKMNHGPKCKRNYKILWKSKWIINKKKKTLWKKYWCRSFDLGWGNNFFDATWSISIKGKKIDKLNFIRIKNLCFKKVKRQPTEWKKVFANYVSDEDIIYRICK